LYVCPGFSPNIITFSDGSSLISGTLSDYIYLQKLDERGYRIWPQPVLAHFNDSTDNPGGTGLVPDGTGGAILSWSDHRGATRGPNGYYNNALHIQRIDRVGSVRWRAGGIELAGASGGRKGGYAVTDGSGGAIFVITESDWDRPGALNIERLWSERYDSNGIQLWRRVYDSTRVRDGILVYNVVRIGVLTYIQTYGGTLAIRLDGIPQPSSSLFFGSSLISDGDSVGYNLRTIRERFDSLGRRYFVEQLTKISSDGDSLWSSFYEILDQSGTGGYSIVRNGLLPDGMGGVFHVWAFRDSVGQFRHRAQRVDRRGALWSNGGLNIVEPIGAAAFAARGSLGICFPNSNHAQKFDTSGIALWPQPFSFISNLGDAFLYALGSDNRGGAVFVFWSSTAGGIRAQHTGRLGQVGVITSVEIANASPNSFELFPNYPNPFNSATNITFALSYPGNVTMAVYDILGRVVKTLTDEQLQPGAYTLTWDASGVASGIYYYRMSTSDGRSLTRKMILLR
jgi:hypothetical protein